MTQIQWSAPGDRTFQTGVDKAVLYPRGKDGVPWNGLVSVSQKTVGGDVTPLYFDGKKYDDAMGPEDFAADISAFTYPPEWEIIEGLAPLVADKGIFVDKQLRQDFDLCYRTQIGNDLEGVDYGYKLHLVYNCAVAPSDKSYATQSNNVAPSNFSWGITTTPIRISGKRASAHIVIDSTQTDPYLLAYIETILYGDIDEIPRLPRPDELFTIFDEWITFEIIDHGDGTWTATGPVDVIKLTGPSSFAITWGSTVITGPDSYTLTTK